MKLHKKISKNIITSFTKEKLVLLNISTPIISEYGIFTKKFWFSMPQQHIRPVLAIKYNCIELIKETKQQHTYFNFLKIRFLYFFVQKWQRKVFLFSNQWFMRHWGVVPLFEFNFAFRLYCEVDEKYIIFSNTKSWGTLLK